MSFAQFNGVSSAEKLFVNSVSFPDGSYFTNAPTSYFQPITPVTDVSSNTVHSIATFSAVPTGIYVLSYGLIHELINPSTNNSFISIGNTANVNFTSGGNQVYSLSNFSFIDPSLNTGFALLENNYSGVLNVISPADIVITTQAQIAITTGTNAWSALPINAEQIALVKLK
jgi:hypothetical protein